MNNTTSNHSDQNKKRNKTIGFGLAAVATSVALVAGALGLSQMGNDVEIASAAEAVEANESATTQERPVHNERSRPVIIAATDDQELPEFELGDIDVPVVEQPSPEAEAPASPPPAPVVDELRTCSSAQYPGAEEVSVINIPANDPDGGLVLHTEPRVDAPVTTIAPEGSQYFVADYVEYSGCVVRPNGDVWWALIGFDTETYWGNASYLAALGAPDGDFHGDESFGEEQDAHADCANLPSSGLDCVVVYRSGGVITLIEAPELLSVEFAQLDCVYNGIVDACDVLEYLGFGFDSNYGLGNSLNQTPTEFLVQDCNALGHGVPAGALACAELALR